MLRAICSVFKYTTTSSVHTSTNRTQRYTRVQENSLENTTSANLLVDKKIKNIEHLNNELHIGITTGLEIKKIEELLKQGADPNGFIPHLKTYPMKDAITHGKLETVKLLLKYKANIHGHPEVLNYMDPYTNLALAAMTNNCDIVKLLLKKGAKPNYKVATCFYTPLAQIPYHNNIEIVKLLIKHGADVNGLNYSDPPLYYCVTTSKTDNNIIKLLLDHGAKPNYHTGYYNLLNAAISQDNPDALLLLLKYMSKDKVKNAKNKMMCSILKYTSVNSMKALLDYSYSVDDTVKLHIAITQDLEIKQIEELLKQGADPNGFIPHLKTYPMKDAITNGKLEIVKLLLNYNADIEGHPKILNSVNSYTNLSYAVEKNNTDIVQLLLEKGVDPNYKAKCSNFHSPLAQASYNNNIEIAKLLLTYGAKVDGLHDEYSPLYYALIKKNKEVSKLLLEHGANTTYGNSYSQPLYHVIDRGYLDGLSLLLKYTSKDQFKNDMNNIIRPLMNHQGYPMKPHTKKCMKVLFDYGYKIDDYFNFLDNNRYIPMTLLMKAIIAGSDVSFIRILLESNANPNAKYENGITLIEQAIKNDRLYIAFQLRRYGAIADATIISKIIDEYEYDPGVTKSLTSLAASTIKKHFENNINDLPIPTDLKRYIKEQKLFIYNDSFIFVD